MISRNANFSNRKCNHKLTPSVSFNTALKLLSIAFPFLANLSFYCLGLLPIKVHKKLDLAPQPTLGCTARTPSGGVPLPNLSTNPCELLFLLNLKHQNFLLVKTKTIEGKNLRVKVNVEDKDKTVDA